jgi:hypothetical protein
MRFEGRRSSGLRFLFRLFQKQIDLLFDGLDVANQGGVLLFELRQVLPESLQPATTAALNEELRSVQLEAIDVELSCLGQRDELTVLIFADVLRDRVTKRVEDTPGRVGLPVVALQIVTNDAGVDPVVGGIHAARGSRLKVVYRQIPAGVDFRRPAVPAPELVASPEGIPFRTTHQVES